MTPELTAELAKPVRMLQIIVGAMVLGVATMLVVAYLVGPQVRQPVGGFDGQSTGQPLITYVSVACGAACLMASFVVPPVIASAGRRRVAAGEYQPCRRSGGPGVPFTEEFYQRTGDAGRMCNVLATTTIVAAAMIEGAALFAAVAFLIDGHILALATAVVLLLALLARFPTMTRAEAWITEQLGSAQLERRPTAS